jgi:hypothetical protein
VQATGARSLSRGGQGLYASRPISAAMPGWFMPHPRSIDRGLIVLLGADARVVGRLDHDLEEGQPAPPLSEQRNLEASRKFYAH